MGHVNAGSLTKKAKKGTRSGTLGGGGKQKREEEQEKSESFRRL